ncbi:MAG: hypothetical protein HY544_01045 [Candidatus Diapherotrites archaeon]|uniref:Uncharacterized protein n=1 Tax=Candidatus Iainarchaeum sp. TaxID=3101447 RepID=A0A8T3YLY3_9ARCH|nr:hypothetical protein [Candidatus Diapherotrites archaeon]
MRGFVFSLDSAGAVVILASAMFLFVAMGNAHPLDMGQAAVMADDAVYALEGSGYVALTLDTNSVSQAAQRIRLELLGLLPGFDANVTVARYEVDEEECTDQQAFSVCFPDSDKSTGSSGVVAAGQYVSGRKFYMVPEPDNGQAGEHGKGKGGKLKVRVYALDYYVWRD